MCTRDALILQFMPLANKLAFKKKRTLPRHIDVDELKSAAYMGLVEAASRYDETLGVAFSTYAYPRIFGAINDYLRSLGSMTTNFGNEEEGISLEEILTAREVTNVDETFDEVTKTLGDQAKNVLRLYFVDDLSMKEVGERFGVSESRISQLLSSYKNELRASVELAA